MASCTRSARRTERICRVRSTDLAALAEAVLINLVGDDQSCPVWLIRLREDRSGVELGLLPVAEHADEPPHPSEFLLGFDAPPDWTGIGISARGSARHLDVPGEPERVRMLYLLHRSGVSASALAGLAPPGPVRPLDTEAEGGLPDLCRRALGLPTPAPPSGPERWWACVWLDRVLAEAALDPGRAWTWSEVVALHPLTELLADPSSAVASGGFAVEIAQLAARISWERMRQTTAAASVAGAAASAVDPEVAAWLDEGSFARLMLGDHLELAALVETLQDLLPGAITRALHEAVEVWEDAK